MQFTIAGMAVCMSAAGGALRGAVLKAVLW